MIYRCLFEQSGTFKNEVKKLGDEAYDYDILNDFGETDYQCDLFNEIEKAYGGGRAYLIHLIKMMFVLLSFLVHDLRCKFSYGLGEKQCNKEIGVKLIN